MSTPEDKLKKIDALLDEVEVKPNPEKVVINKKAATNRKIREIYPTSGHCWHCNQPIIDLSGGE